MEKRPHFSTSNNRLFLYAFAAWMKKKMFAYSIYAYTIYTFLYVCLFIAFFLLLHFRFISASDYLTVKCMALSSLDALCYSHDEISSARARAASIIWQKAKQKVTQLKRKRKRNRNPFHYYYFFLYLCENQELANVWLTLWLCCVSVCDLHFEENGIRKIVSYLYLFSFFNKYTCATQSIRLLFSLLLIFLIVFFLLIFSLFIAHELWCSFLHLAVRWHSKSVGFFQTIDKIVWKEIDQQFSF